MRWRQYRRSSNIEDRRGQRAGAAALPIAALMRFLPFLLRTKWGRILLLGGALFFGYQYLTGGGTGLGLQQALPDQRPAASASSVPDDDREFVAAVLATTETVWHQLLPERYTEPTLVLYSDVTPTGCGTGQAQSGPFYCPADSKIYIDLSFMRELKRLGAPGDFAFAYVIAHEVAHHVQNNLGISSRVHRLRQAASQIEANRLSVRLELQADCFAGVWGHYVSEQLGLLEAGDIEEGIQAASSVGDDRLQKMAGRAVQPEAFTHGSSSQRVAWFQRGFSSGQPGDCDTFSDQ